MSAGFLDVASRQYWKHALWLTAGITLIALLAANVMYAPVDISSVMVAVLFSLLSGGAMEMVIKHVAKQRKPCLGTFLTYATLRIVVALALIAGYMMVTGLRGRQLLPFVILLSVYFILLDALDAWYMVRVQKVLESEP